MDTNLLKQYIKIVNYSLIGLVFAFASFYLLSNLYHYFEIRKDYITTFDSEKFVLDYEEKIKQIEDNISAFNSSNYHGNVPISQMSILYYNLKSCVNSFQNETFQSMKGKEKITIIDVYQLREAYEDNILGDCIVNNLYLITTADENSLGSTFLAQNRDLIQLYINGLRSETSYLKKDLLNNSSYFYNTSIASASIKNNTRDGFDEVMGSYNKAVDFVNYISKWFRSESLIGNGDEVNE